MFLHNKIRRGIWTLMVRKFHLLRTVSCPILEFEPLASTTTNVVQNLSLGWKHAMTGGVVSFGTFLGSADHCRKSPESNAADFGNA